MKIIKGQSNTFLLLTARNASHSFAAAALKHWYPDEYLEWYLSASESHPAIFLPNLVFGIDCYSPAIIVRNPIERFRSMCAHRQEKTIEEHLKQPIYGSLPKGNFQYFLFESQLEECAEWLGLPLPLPHIDASVESNKPILTPEQETSIRQIYAYDIALWESLQPSV
jgi:hypothetical protein